MQVQALDHIHIYSREPEAAVAFYCDHFGAEVTGTLGGDGARTLTLVALGGHIVIIGPYPPGAAPQPPAPYTDGSLAHGYGVAHLGLRVDDVDAAVAELRAAGVPVHAEPVQEDFVRYAYVGAPDGVVLELTQYGG